MKIPGGALRHRTLFTQRDLTRIVLLNQDSKIMTEQEFEDWSRY